MEPEHKLPIQLTKGNFMSKKISTQVLSTLSALSVAATGFVNPQATAADAPNDFAKQSNKASANCMIVGASPKNNIQKSITQMFTRLNKSPFFSQTIYPKIKGSVTVCDNPRVLGGAYAGYACANNTIYINGSGQADMRGIDLAHEAQHAARRDCPKPSPKLNNAQKVQQRWLMEGTAEAAAKFTAIQLAERGDDFMLQTALQDGRGYGNVAEAMLQTKNRGGNQSAILNAGVTAWLDSGIASSTLLDTIQYMNEPRCIMKSGPAAGNYAFTTPQTRETFSQRVQEMAQANGYNCAPGRR